MEQAAHAERRRRKPASLLKPLEFGFYRIQEKSKTCALFGGPAPDRTALPRCASWEIGKAEFLSLEKARELIHPDQCEFIDRLQKLIGEES